MPCRNTKAFTKGHSFPSPYGLWGHLGAIRVPNHGHPVPERVRGTRGALVDVKKSCQRLAPFCCRQEQGGTGPESPEEYSSPPLSNSFLGSRVVKTLSPGSQVILKNTQQSTKLKVGSPFLFTSGGYKGMAKCVQNTEDQAYVSHRQQTSQRAVISEGL